MLSASCINQSAQGTTQPSPTFIGLDPTWTPHITTFTPSPTSIIVYTYTPTFTPWPTPTITATLHREPTETPYYLKADFPKACQQQFLDSSTQISPDGIWLAEICFDAKGMQISNRTGTETLLVPFDEVYSNPMLPDATGSVRPVHWSNDSQFLFFTVDLEADRVIGSISETTSALFRIKLSDGRISQILGGYVYYSFSPTDRRLIEVQESIQPVKIVIHDLKTGMSNTISPVGDPLFSQAGDVIWSQDGLKFAVVAGYGWSYGDKTSEQWIHSLIVVDMDNLSQQTIVQKIPMWVDIISWDENDLITYTIFEKPSRISYKYDYNSRSIVWQATATP
jgi:hypothetical protein